MDVYKYEALANDGKKITGSILADDRGHAHNLLRDKQYHPVTIRKAYFASQKISLEDLLLFFFHLDLQLKCKVRINKAIESFVECHGNRILKASLVEVLQALKNGESLGDTFEKFSDIFDQVTIGLLKSAEKTGKMSEAIANILKFLKLKSHWKSKVKQAIAYPIFITVVAIVILVFSVVMLGPQVVSLIQNCGNGETPPVTMFVIDVLPLLSKIVCFLLPIILSTLCVLMISKSGRSTAMEMLLRIPKIGPLIIKSNLWQVFKIMQISLDSKLTFVTSLKLAMERVMVESIKSQLATALGNIVDGYSISDSFAKIKYVAGESITAINIGEKGNDLCAIFHHISDAQYDEIIAEITVLGKQLSIGLTMLTGLIFVLILCGLFHPIYSYVEIAGT
jgi:type IV pilus assembly protein PilC